MTEQTNERLDGGREPGSPRSFSRGGNRDTGLSGCAAHTAGPALMRKQVEGIIFTAVPPSYLRRQVPYTEEKAGAVTEGTPEW